MLGGAAQALLGTAEEQVHVPLVHVHGRAAEAGYGVHVEERYAQIFLQLAEGSQGVQRAGRRFAVHGGEHDRFDAADGVFNDRQIVNGGVVGQGNLFHDAAEGGRHVGHTVAENARAHGDHGIARLQAAFQRAPEGQHPFARHEYDVVGRAHESGEAAAGGVVEAHEIGFDLTGTVIPAEYGDHVLVQGDRAGNHGDGSVTHAVFLMRSLVWRRTFRQGEGGRFRGPQAARRRP